VKLDVCSEIGTQVVVSGDPAKPRPRRVKIANERPGPTQTRVTREPPAI
jgi:hypothetical protein